jgi:ABC-2 type transport system permease protein
LIGLILIFVMLSQYNTWTLIGVLEEKSSRVIEVLLATVRPIQLLTGKVLGIGLVAFAQASLIVVFALALAKSVGSDLLHGTAPVEIVSTLAWLLLGYGFYCWVYAAAGSLAQRQDQVQSLAFPLSLPIIFGYIMALTAVGSGSPSTLFKVLAYLPPTAPFAMPVLVGLDAVTWWEFLASVLISLVCTVGVARLATSIYRRAILRTGTRVKLREVVTSGAR